jgi:integrase
VKLDAKTISKLSLGNRRDAIYFDESMPGFGFRIRQGAGGKISKQWIVQYRRAGSTRRLLLGPANVLTVTTAREAARKILARIALGEDPARERDEQRRKDTFSATVAEYLANKATARRGETMRQVTRYLTKAYFKPLHSVPLDAIMRRDVAGQLVALQRRHGSTTAKLARTALSAFFAWAMEMGLAESNPVIGTPKPVKAPPRERVLSDQELAAVWQAGGNDDFGKIVKLLILTGCRRQEIGGMRWEEIDIERGIFALPAVRSKNNRALILPLPPPAVEIIATVPRLIGRRHLFGERGYKGFSSWARFKSIMDKAVTIPPWRIHDIRRSVATGMANIGIFPHVIEAVLNHVSGHKAGIAGVYNLASYQAEVKDALLLWADHIRTIVDARQ